MSGYPITAGEVWEDRNGKRIELLRKTQVFPAWWLVRPLDGSGDHGLSEWAIVQGRRV